MNGPDADVFDFPPGDTSIMIRLDRVGYFGHVSSIAMALGSPVWKNLIFPS